MEISFTTKIVLVFLGIIVVWALILVPINRFFKRQQAESEAWTEEAVAQRIAEIEKSRTIQSEKEA